MGSPAGPGSIRSGKGNLSIWRVPNFLLEARGYFLGRRDEFADKLARARSLAGTLVLAGLGIAYPRYAENQPNTVTASPGAPKTVVTAVNYAGVWLDLLLTGIAVSAVCIAIVMAMLVATGRSGSRRALAKQLAWAPLAFLLFIGLIFAAGGLLEFLNTKVGAWVSHRPATVHYGGDIVIFLISLLMAVWVFKAIYLAAVDLFRADDAHPLLAPVASTVVSWALAIPGLLDGVPQEVPHLVGLGIGWLGSITVTIINILACVRLWREHHTLLFRDGPLAAAPSPESRQATATA